jgi:hypothetical protein
MATTLAAKKALITVLPKDRDVERVYTNGSSRTGISAALGDWKHL